jgi:Protein of unknown function (DUF3237)
MIRLQPVRANVSDDPQFMKNPKKGKRTMNSKAARAATIGCAFSIMTFGAAEAQTTTLKSEYLMTFYATLKPPSVVSNNFRVFDVPSGWVEGPRIKGKIVPPTGDWSRTIAPGLNRLDVRAVIQTDDDQIIQISYNGVVQCPKEISDKLANGEVAKADDCYFVGAPTFETSSERYSWLSTVQAVGKMVELKRAATSNMKSSL